MTVSNATLNPSTQLRIPQKFHVSPLKSEKNRFLLHDFADYMTHRPVFLLYSFGLRTKAGRRPDCSCPRVRFSVIQIKSPRSGMKTRVVIRSPRVRRLVQSRSLHAIGMADNHKASPLSFVSRESRGSALRSMLAFVSLVLLTLRIYARREESQAMRSRKQRCPGMARRGAKIEVPFRSRLRFRFAPIRAIRGQDTDFISPARERCDAGRTNQQTLIMLFF